MGSRALSAILSVRQAAVREASVALAAAIAREEAASAAEASAIDAFSAEMTAAFAADGAGQMIPQFSTWQSHARQVRRCLSDQHRAAQAETSQFRANLATARQEEEIIVKIIENKNKEKMTILQKKEQDILLDFMIMFNIPDRTDVRGS